VPIVTPFEVKNARKVPRKQRKSQGPDVQESSTAMIPQRSPHSTWSDAMQAGKPVHHAERKPNPR
jgi:hypothetical protein